MDSQEDFSSKRYSPKTIEAMKDVLMDPKASGPAVLYHMVRGGKELGNITIWEPGTVGGEYIKTYGHYHVGDFCEAYRVLYGEGIVILQKRALDLKGRFVDDQIEEVKIIKVSAGDAVFMPKGWAHAVLNVGKTLFVTEDDTLVTFGEIKSNSANYADYEPIKKMRGMAYYVVEEDGRPVLIKNPLYKKVPEASILEYSPSFGQKS